MNGVSLNLDLREAHERRYFFSHWFNLYYPQSDIDRLIFERFLRPGDVVLDAGANIGFTALQMLQFRPRAIHCFEPVKSLFDRLALLHHPALRLYQAALSDRSESSEMFLSASHNQGSTLEEATVKLFPAVFGQQPPMEKVQSYCLDDILPDIEFDFMKVDIEGSESRFLRGAQKLLSARPPRALQMEIYEPSWTEAFGLAKGYFRHCWRALISREQYSLILVPHDTEICWDEFWLTAPTYIFMN